MQMFSTRPQLSTFLIRDAASKLGRRLPVYGGADSRTELAMIRMTDFLIELMEAVSARLRVRFRRPHVEASVDGVIHSLPRTRLGRWIDRKACERIRDYQRVADESQDESQDEIRVAA